MYEIPRCFKGEPREAEYVKSIARYGRLHRIFYGIGTLGLETKEDLMAVFSIWRALLRQECLLLLYRSKE